MGLIVVGQVRCLYPREEASADPGSGMGMRGVTHLCGEGGVIKAKLLARHGQFTASRRRDAEGARLAPAGSPLAQATAHEASAEAERLAGASGQAAARLRAALEIYQDRRATVLAERASTARAGLAAEPSGDCA